MKFVISGILMALALAGCGSSDESTTTITPETRTVTVEPDYTEETYTAPEVTPDQMGYACVVDQANYMDTDAAMRECFEMASSYYGIQSPDRQLFMDGTIRGMQCLVQNGLRGCDLTE